ncbi:MAG: nicotinate (nicotinamide) nucleotide adenylyltransferase [Victivallales bacterium]|nr:nicotinate (nicotinamide) nucleotide adenylyltransferase [Victivallales bacterium]
MGAFGQNKKKESENLPKLPFVHRRRVAVFGGSFDPLHLGHVNLAKYLLGTWLLAEDNDNARSSNICIAERIRRSPDILERYHHRLEKYNRQQKDIMAGAEIYRPMEEPERPQREHAIEEILFIPALCSPFKEGTAASPAHRLEMLRRVCLNNDGFSYTDIELRRSGKSYSFDTMDTLTKVLGELELHFVMGMDSLEGLANWYRAEEFVQRFNFIIYPRPGASCPSYIDLEKAFGSRGANKLRASILDGNDVPTFPISSTEVRNRIAEGSDLSELLPQEVIDYIAEHRLYQNS